MLLSSQTNAEKHVNRLNYGVVYDLETSVDIVVDHWPITFVVPFPPPPSIVKDYQPVIECDSNKNTECTTTNHIITYINHVKRNSNSHSNLSYCLAMEVVPNEFPDESPTTTYSSLSRKIRGWFDAVGEFVHTAFGIATDKNINHQKHAIHQIETHVEKTDHAILEMGEDLASFIKLSDQNDALFKVGMQTNHDDIVETAKRIYAMNQGVMKNLELASLMSKQIYFVLDNQVRFSEFRSALNGMLNGRLDPDTVPPKYFTYARENITQELRKRQSSLKAKHLSTFHMYSKAEFIYSFKKGSLYITYMYPLVDSSSSRVNIYKISTFNFPLNDTVTMSTKVRGLSEYVGIIRSSDIFITFDGSVWGNDIINVKKHHIQQLSIQQYKSCEIALFFDNKEDIKSSCHHDISQEPLLPSIRQIKGGTFLLTNVSELMITCPSSVRNKPGCKYCVARVPCYCMIRGDGILAYSGTDGCHDITEITIVHHINLGGLTYFHTPDYLANITGGSNFSTVPHMPIPDFHIKSSSFVDHSATLQNNIMRMENFAEAVRKDGYVHDSGYGPVAEYIDRGGANQMYIFGSLIAGLFVYCIILTLKFRTLSQALILAHRVDTVISKSYLHILPTTTTEPPTDYRELLEYYRNEKVLEIITLLSVIVCILFILFRYLRNKPSTHATVMLELSSGVSCTQIELCDIAYC